MGLSVFVCLDLTFNKKLQLINAYRGKQSWTMYTYVLIWQIVQRCSCLTVWGCIGVAFLQMPNVAQIGVHCLNAFCVSIVIHCSPLAMVDIYWKCTVQKHTIESYSNKIKVKNKTKLQHNWNSSNSNTLCLFVCVIVLNATLKNISGISRMSVL